MSFFCKQLEALSRIKSVKLVLFLVALTVSAQESVPLKWNAQNKKKISVRIKTLKISTTGKSAPYRIDGEFSGMLTLQREKGRIEFEKGKLKSTADPKVEVSSDDEEADAGLQGKILDEFHSGIDFKINKKEVVIDSSLNDAVTAALFMKPWGFLPYFGLVLPEKPVAVGKTWELPSVYDGKPGTRILKLEKVEDYNGMKCAVITTNEGLIPSVQDFPYLEYDQLFLNAKYYFNLEYGVLVGAKIRIGCSRNSGASGGFNSSKRWTISITYDAAVSD